MYICIYNTYTKHSDRRDGPEEDGRPAERPDDREHAAAEVPGAKAI